MRRLQKSKKVSWASDVNLRQEKLFLSEDPPSQVGQRPQNQLQAKKKANGFHSYNHFPYRLQVAQPTSQMKLKRPAVGLPKWQCPPTFLLKPNWLNVAGEESKERQVQNQREMSVLEAFYPYPSVIPSNPSVSTEVKVSYYNDLVTPIIRITPIEDEEEEEEEEEEVVNPSSHFEEPVNNIHMSSPPSILTQLERNLVAPASSSTFNSVMTSSAKQEVDSIDFVLLMKILRNPKMLETLITDFGKPSSDFESAPKPSSPPTMEFSTPHSCLAPANINNSKEQLGTISSAAPVTNVVASTSILNTSPQHGFSQVSSPMVKSPSPPSLAATVTNIVAPLSNPNVPPPHGFSRISTTPVVKASPPIPPLKDIHYYKSLIQQHGKERPKVHDQNLRRFGKNKRKRPNLIVEPKPVMNSNQGKSRGSFWKGGSNYAATAYQPDIPFGQRFSSTTILPQVHCAKRMKLNQEILGRT